MEQWIAESATSIAERAVRHLEALVGVSTPSGDVEGANEAAAIAAALLPDHAVVERPPCSSPDHAPDLLARVAGTGAGRILLLGHLDTVVAHAEHKPLTADPTDPDRLYGSGTVDMKGGDVLALGVLSALAQRPELYAEVALLLVMDEEWRVGPFTHVERFAHYDACLCFEAGEVTSGVGDDAVVVKRKAAGTVEVTAHGRSAHSGAAPDKGRNALLALAAAAQAVAAEHDPQGPDHLTAVPTVVRSGDAFNVVPAAGTLIADVRADRLDAFARVLDAIPAEVGGATLTARLARQWPGMDARAATAPLLEHASSLLGRPIVGADRGGASDASHFAAAIPLTVDGLGPRGGAAHNPGEFVLVPSLRTRAEVALAIALAVLTPTR